MTTQATCLGFPRIGHRRELKKAVEGFWKGSVDDTTLRETCKTIRRTNWELMRGLDSVPVNDFSMYDQVLDTLVMLGAVPKRYSAVKDATRRYFAMARGVQEGGVDLTALEMTKWFDTNYHYIVPEIAADQSFALCADKLVAELEEAQALGLQARPVILGPVSFLLLAKSPTADYSPLQALDKILPVYTALFAELHRRNIKWLQLDEPFLVTDLNDAQRKAFMHAFKALSAGKRPHVMLTSYFDALGENADLALQSGFEGLHLDLCRAPAQLDKVLRDLPKTMSLSLGLINGRNIWRADLDAGLSIIERVQKALGEDRTWVSSSCSLLHAPMDTQHEARLPEERRAWLAFAAQKVEELACLARPNTALLTASRQARAHHAKLAQTPAVRTRMQGIKAEMAERHSPFAKRAEKQRKRFGLPLFPTTTIGSFPQTKEVRAARASWRKGDWDDARYDTFLREETRRCIERQEGLGLDVLVHGEFERNDMVEYFGEHLDGFLFTENGWVQSYGSRCVKPPVLFGDVSRRGPMTVDWSKYAQSLTKRPMKGMLTGPVTIMQWSFVRDDQPREETCRQIALALRDEVTDLEAAGIGMIQVDEPAIREGLPIRRADRDGYLRWAVNAFKLATCGVKDETQVHTHMCYSEFGDMFQSIADMDADVLSIEASRSNLEILQDFAKHKYPNEVGPGVYDVHSARVPAESEVTRLLDGASEVLDARQIWVNPDCGLKTRGWPEVDAALKNMVAAAGRARASAQRAVRSA